MDYFTGQYGKIDWVESNNEYWLELDTQLRTDFNITTGLKSDEIEKYKSKFAMKEYYRKAGIPCARCCPVTTLDAALAFTHEVGYPVIVKPDNSVGAIATWKLQSDEDTVAFFSELPPVPYLMEKYVTGVVTTYDGVCDSRGEVLFAASHITRNSIMDMVNEGVPTYYYVDKEVPADVEAAGKAALKAFGASSRFFHLTEGKEGLGKRGDIVALEVNMRPTGGFTPDMLNFSQSTDVYQIWADMVAFDELRHTYDGPHFYCIYAGRPGGHHGQPGGHRLLRHVGGGGRFRPHCLRPGGGLNRPQSTPAPKRRRGALRLREQGVEGGHHIIGALQGHQHDVIAVGDDAGVVFPALNGVGIPGTAGVGVIAHLVVNAGLENVLHRLHIGGVFHLHQGNLAHDGGDHSHVHAALVGLDVAKAGIKGIQRFSLRLHHGGHIGVVRRQGLIESGQVHAGGGLALAPGRRLGGLFSGLLGGSFRRLLSRLFHGLFGRLLGRLAGTVLAAGVFRRFGGRFLLFSGSFLLRSLLRGGLGNLLRLDGLHSLHFLRRIRGFLLSAGGQGGEQAQGQQQGKDLCFHGILLMCEVCSSSQT